MKPSLIQQQQWLRELGCSDHEIEFAHTSRDAIVPVIEKQINTVDKAQHFLKALSDCKNDWTPSPTVNQIKFICSTPSQLCIALLRATGKWTDQ